MALTLDYMRGLVRSRLDDTDFESTFLDSALNYAQRQITNNRNLTFLDTVTTVTLPAGASTTTYPAGVRNLLSISVTAIGVPQYDITNNYVDYTDFNAGVFVSAGTSTAPIYWTKFNGQIIFPANADKAYTITYTYVRNSPKVDGTIVNTFDIPDEYEELLMIGAYMRIAKREDDYVVTNQEKIDYKDLLAQLLHDYARNQGPRKIHIMRRGR